MRVLRARWVAGCLAVLSIALIAGALVLAYADRHRVPGWLTGWTFSDVSGSAVNLAIPVVGFFLASRRPGNRIGWLVLVAGLALGLSSFAAQYALHALLAAPGSLPEGRALAWLANWVWVIQLAMLAFMFLLFPTGQLHSRQWRLAGWFVGGAFGIAAAEMLVAATRWWSHPFTQFSQLERAVLLSLMAVALLVSVAALVVRFARSSGDERLQLKWFAAAAVLVAATFATSIWTNSAAAHLLQNLAFACLSAAVAVAVLKYRLYDIDIVITKAVLFGSLAVSITAVYASLVVGVGTLAGNRRSPLLTAAAAAVVAVAFQPARRRAAKLANRVVYGRRATPYQVLSDFARRVGGTYAAGEVLPQMAQIVAAGTGASRVVVWLRVGGELHAEASSDGDPPGVSVAVDGQILPPLADGDISVPVVHQGELLGAIAITMPKGEPLRPAGQQLVADVASQAGLALANAGLIEDLRASRQRLVTAQDDARRRLERNLHDGAQQDLVALAIKVGLGTTVDDLAEARQIFSELKADTAGALENLRDLARGIYPPLLADLGLAAALSAQAGKSAVPVTVDANGVGRFGQDTEAAVYFCCLEALQNAAKHARATSARICLQAENGSLSFIISDDGVGYDSRHTPMGSGQRNLADRLAALGGRLEIRSAPGHGTTITGRLPTSPPPAHASRETRQETRDLGPSDRSSPSLTRVVGDDGVTAAGVGI